MIDKLKSLLDILDDFKNKEFARIGDISIEEAFLVGLTLGMIDRPNHDVLLRQILMDFLKAN